jgi:ribosome biogenesis protein YTM1
MLTDVNFSVIQEETQKGTRIDDETLIQVRFHTRQSQFAVTESIITVPARLRRYGFSEIINHLLNHVKPIPFDFVIDGEFLRTSLARFMEMRAISSVSGRIYN